jgi:hypothetical protein
MAMDPSSMLYINIAIRSKSNNCQQPVHSASSCQLASDWFFQILGTIYFDDKTTSNQQILTDKLAPIKDVFESLIGRFEMAYTLNEHQTIFEQLVVFRHKCPFYMFIK